MPDIAQSNDVGLSNLLLLLNGMWNGKSWLLGVGELWLDGRGGGGEVEMRRGWSGM